MKKASPSAATMSGIAAFVNDIALLSPLSTSVRAAWRAVRHIPARSLPRNFQWHLGTIYPLLDRLLAFGLIAAFTTCRREIRYILAPLDGGALWMR